MIRALYEIQCDDCCDVEDFDTGGMEAVSGIAAAARAAGWKFIRCDGKIKHLCPACRKKKG